MATEARCMNKSCDAAFKPVLVNLGYTKFDICDDDTWKYRIKCHACKTSCGRTSRDTAYLCDTVWKFQGERADGVHREDEGYCDGHPYCMETCDSANIQDAAQWR